MADKHAVGFHKIKGKVETEATAFIAVMTLLGKNGDEYGLFASNADALERLWKIVAPTVGLDRTRLQQVAIFSEKSVKGSAPAHDEGNANG